MSQDENQNLIVVVCSRNWDTSSPPHVGQSPVCVCIFYCEFCWSPTCFFPPFKCMLKIEQCIIMKWRGEDVLWVSMQPLTVVGLGLCQQLLLPIFLGSYLFLAFESMFHVLEVIFIVIFICNFGCCGFGVFRSGVIFIVMVSFSGLRSPQASYGVFKTSKGRFTPVHCLLKVTLAVRSRFNGLLVVTLPLTSNPKFHTLWTWNVLRRNYTLRSFNEWQH